MWPCGGGGVGNCFVVVLGVAFKAVLEVAIVVVLVWPLW